MDSSDEPRGASGPPGTRRSDTAGPPPSARPLYKGAPLEAAQGPGLGCFWFQVVVLGILLVLTPILVINRAPLWLTGTLLFVTLGLLFFAGQTVIFLLRLVAADRRSRRRPMRSGTKTVGELEDETGEGREPGREPDR